MEQISEAFKSVSLQTSLSVSPQSIDKQNNQGKIFIAKNRNGPDGRVYDIFMDTSNVKIKTMPKTNTVSANPKTAMIPGNPVALGTKQQKELLQNKYDKFRKRK